MARVIFEAMMSGDDRLFEASAALGTVRAGPGMPAMASAEPNDVVMWPAWGFPFEERVPSQAPSITDQGDGGGP